jgi:hypothetical protein
LLATLAFWEIAFAAEIEVAWKSPHPHVPGSAKNGQKRPEILQKGVPEKWDLRVFKIWPFSDPLYEPL